MKRIILLLVAVAAMWAPITMVAAPAEAGTCTLGICGHIAHYSPDDGYDPDIIARCNFGDPSTDVRVEEGTSSTQDCRDTDQVYVRYNEEIWCKFATTSVTTDWRRSFDAQGWHKIEDNWDDGLGCTLRND